MLAYVFWHVPVRDIDSAAYDSRLVRFHAALAMNPAAGFLRSFSTRTSRLPWLGDAADATAETAYEDWYIIADSAALDSLDAAAIDAGRRESHDDAARVARTGTGGLYRLLRGEPIVPSETVWFAKPAGMTYAGFAPVLDAMSRDGSTLWQRMMVLGPAPEYAAQKRTPSNDVANGRIVHRALTPICRERFADVSGDIK